MRLQLSSDGSSLHTLLTRLAELASIPVSPLVVRNYAKEIRRVRGSFIATQDAAMMAPGSAADEQVDRASRMLLERVASIVRNYVVFGFLIYWPIGTTVYISSDEKDGSTRILVLSCEEKLPSCWRKLI